MTFWQRGIDLDYCEETEGRAPNIVSERLNEIETLLPQVRNALRLRKVIS